MSSDAKVKLGLKEPTQMRKRPVQARSSQTVKNILMAVEQVLEREGIDHFTVSHVAECAGYSIGSLYQYFPDKFAMLSALADYGQDKAQNAMLVQIQKADPCNLEVIARIIVRLTLECNSDFADKVGAMILNRFDRREFGHVKDRHNAFAAFVLGALAEFAADEIRPLSEESCFILVSAILGPIQCAYLADPSVAWTEEFENELVHLFVAFAKSGNL